MSLIRLHLNRFGHIELFFVNPRIRRRVLQTLIANGGPKDRTAYLQHDGDVGSLMASLSRKRGGIFAPGGRLGSRALLRA